MATTAQIWKTYSARILAGLAVIPVAWEAARTQYPELIQLLPDGWTGIIIPTVAAIGLFLRFIPQPSVIPPTSAPVAPQMGLMGGELRKRFAFGDRSLKALTGVHPDLVRVMMRAIELTPVDFMIIEGVRSDEQCLINFGKGRTAAQLRARGIDVKYAKPQLKMVTWVKDPFNTKHRKQKDGYGHAVDFLPAPYDWKDPMPFQRVAEAVFKAANELNVKVRWGKDWDSDGNYGEPGESDSPHIELM